MLIIRCGPAEKLQLSWSPERFAVQYPYDFFQIADLGPGCRTQNISGQFPVPEWDQGATTGQRLSLQPLGHKVVKGLFQVQRDSDFNDMQWVCHAVGSCWARGGIGCC